MKPVLACVAMLLVSPGEAKEISASVAAFTRIPVGARAPALGGGIAAIDREATAALSNPAGLAQLREPLTVILSGTKLPYAQHLYYIGAAGWATPELSLGLSALLFSAGDDIEFRSANTLAPDSVESASSQLYTFAIAGRLFPVMDVGLAAKFIVDSIGPVSANGFSMDFGLHYRPYRRLALALVVNDMAGTSFDWNTGGSDRFKSYLRIGGAVDLNPILLVAEVARPSGSALYRRYSGGVEWDIHPSFLLRLGYNDGRLAAGFGAHTWYQRWATLRLDYAFAQGVLRTGGFEHRVALTFGYRMDNPRNPEESLWPMGKLIFPTEELGAPQRPKSRPQPLFRWPKF